MKSCVILAGHPVHPLFVTIAIGLCSFVAVYSFIYTLDWGDASWKVTAFYCVSGSLIGALPALITRWADFGAIKNVQIQVVEKFHLILNAIFSFLLLVSLGLRYQEFKSAFSLLPAGIAFLGAFLLGILGWLGGELTSRFGISVHRSRSH